MGFFLVCLFLFSEFSKFSCCLFVDSGVGFFLFCFFPLGVVNVYSLNCVALETLLFVVPIVFTLFGQQDQLSFGLKFSDSRPWCAH